MTSPGSGRVRIRPTLETDLDWVLGAEAEPENAFGILPWSRAQHRAAIDAPDARHWTVEAEPGARRVGFLILRGVGSPDRAVELKRILVTEKGRGFGRAALGAAIDLAFDDLGAHRLWLDVFTDNERAWRLYESAGFVREGTLRECCRDGDRWRSLVLLAMLESERPKGTGRGH